MYRYLLLPCLSFLAMPAIADSCRMLSSVDWLLGNWVSQSTSGVTTESWTKVSANTVEGVGATTVAGKRQSSESLRLVAMEGEVFYLAKVGHNPVPAAFKLTHCTSKNAVFENPDHDFPNRIEYNAPSQATLNVTVSDNAGKGFSIVFTRAEK